MKLERVRIDSFRSIFDFAPGAGSLDVDLADGVNILVGPNNCGKSNIVRAVELALQPDLTIDRHADLPTNSTRAKPRIQLTFRLGPSDAALDLKQAIERLHAMAGSPKCQHGNDQIVLRVSFERNEARDSYYRSVDFGFRMGDSTKDRRALDDAVALFYKRVRFVISRSGESLESILEGRFRGILREVVEETLREQYEAAIARREDYLDDLQEALFGPLTSRVSEDLKLIFPEINDVQLRPKIPVIDETISNLSIQVSDAAITELAAKGTGVRGGLIAAMFRYLAEHSKHSMVFAVEEPEAFLHPAAQENVRDSLEHLAHRDEVTVIATTHSPFMVPRRPDAKLFSVTKSAGGSTSIGETARGDEPRATLLGGLFRDPKLSYVLDAAAQIPPSARAVLVVEGETDIAFLRRAGEVLGRTDVLDGLHLMAGGGAGAAATLAVVVQAGTDLPVCTLFDNDEIGRAAYERLRGSTFKRHISPKSVLNYRSAFRHNDVPYEAEDLFASELQQRFADAYPSDMVVVEHHPDGTMHLDFPIALKWEFATFVTEQATAAHCDRWSVIFDLLAPFVSSDRPRTTVPAGGVQPRHAPPGEPSAGAESGREQAPIPAENSVEPLATAADEPAAPRRRPTELETLLRSAPPEVRRMAELLDRWAVEHEVERVPLAKSVAYRTGGKNVTLLWPQYKGVDVMFDHLTGDGGMAVREECGRRLGKEVGPADPKRQWSCVQALEHWEWFRTVILDPRAAALGGDR